MQRDSQHCMIAEAIKEGNPHFKAILVDLQTIRWTNPRTKKRYVCLTPEVAAAALVAFDQGGEIEPFGFVLKTVQSTPTRGSGKPRGGRKLTNQLTIDGGEPLRAGHLRGGSDTSRAAARAKGEAEREATEPAEGDSNVKRSSTRYRRYGRRLLQA